MDPKEAAADPIAVLMVATSEYTRTVMPAFPAQLGNGSSAWQRCVREAQRLPLAAVCRVVEGTLILL
jgi:hypothetical protein